MSADANAASRREVLRRGAAATDALFVGTATAGTAAAATVRGGPDGPIVDEGEATKERANRTD